MNFLTFLATGLLLLSDSDLITHMDHPSIQTQFFWDHDLTQNPLDDNLIYGKKVLIVVHGYNNCFEAVLKTMNRVKELISTLKSKEQTPLYDLMIGYVWPGTSNFFEYDQANKNINRLVSRMRSHLINLKQLDCSIDILAHSLGNRLVLEALKEPYTEPLINYFYALGPAIEASSFNDKLHNVCSNCHNLFVFYSHQDKILKLIYPLISGKKALGLNSQNSLNLPPYVQLIDCSKLIKSHSSYFETKAIYRFMERSHLDLNLSPSESCLVSLKEDGSVKVLKK
jgi:esterase/lipase superfamily enzyme